MTEKEQKWLHALITIREVLSGFNLNYFLDTGTLLGAVRDKQFIPWDNDIDIGVLGEVSIELMQKISDAFYKKQFNVACVKRNIALRKQIDCIEIEIGIKFYYLEGNYYRGSFEYIDIKKYAIFYSIYLGLLQKVFYKKGHTSKFIIKSIFMKILSFIGNFVPNPLVFYILRKKTNFIEKQIYIPQELLAEISNIIFYNEYFSVPKSAEDYLTFRYGDNWNIPKQNYNFITEDQSLK